MSYLEESSNSSFSDDVFHYSAFGFKIVSSLALPSLLPHDGQIDLNDCASVQISESTKSESELWRINTDNWLDISDNVIIFRIDDVGQFHIRDGKEIIFFRDDGSAGNSVLDKDVSVFILGSCFGAIALQKNMLPLHGSVAVVDGSAIAFVGNSGAGKSTILGSYIACGYKMLTDDVCVLSFVNDKPIVSPAYPQCKYNEDSAKLLGHSFHNMSWINRFKSKKYLNVSDHFEKHKCELSRIVLIETSSTIDSMKIKEIHGIEKFEIIYQNAYRQAFHDGPNRMKEISQQVAHCAQHCKVFKLVRPTSRTYKPAETVEIVNTNCFI